MGRSDSLTTASWRVVVVGGHTRNIGKTQLLCDVIRALPEARWIAVKITQYGHGICARNAEGCHCAPEEHAAALDWETHKDTGTDTARFLEAGADHALWLRTKQGRLAEGLPLLREALAQVRDGSGEANDSQRNLILESNSLLQFVQPALWLVVLDPRREDFKESLRVHLDRADAFVLRSPVEGSDTKDKEQAPVWKESARALLAKIPRFLQVEGSPLPAGLVQLLRATLAAGPRVSG